MKSIKEILSNWNFYAITREFLVTTFIIFLCYLSIPGVLMFLELLQSNKEKELILTAFVNVIIVFAITFAVVAKIVIKTNIKFSMFTIFGALSFILGSFSYVGDNQKFIYLFITFCILYFGLYGIEVYKTKKLLSKDKEIINNKIIG